MKPTKTRMDPMSDTKITADNAIVVAVDGSEASATAVAWAANAATKRGASLKLVTAYTMPQFMYADGMVPPQELYDELEAEALEKINNAREQVAAHVVNLMWNGLRGRESDPQLRTVVPPDS